MKNIIIQVCFIILFLFLKIFTIIIQPINLIIGLVCVLFLPGYNLLKIIKPKFDFIALIGYTFIISLAVGNLFMFLQYLLLYDLVTSPTNLSFYFNEFLLILGIQMINLVLIILRTFKDSKESRNESMEKDYSSIWQKKKVCLKPKNTLCFIIFIISLFLFCISAFYSDVPTNSWPEVYYEYKSSYTFFLRVPAIFYFFLGVNIIFLILFLYNSNSIYLNLLMISLFLFSLWILPYLQIKNFFSNDAKFLSSIYESYLDIGIKTAPEEHVSFVPKPYLSLKYSTSIFTTILLCSATNVDSNFILWYIFPFIFFFLPFFFYSIFKKYEMNSNSNFKLIFIIIVAFLTPDTIKNIHSARTGIFGSILFLMLIIELLDLFQNIKFSIANNFGFICFLYFFLALTHREECLYFLIIIITSSLYYCIFEIGTKFKKVNKEIIFNFSIDEDRKRSIKKILRISSFLIIILGYIFYFTLEFFNSIADVKYFTSSIDILDVFFSFYDSTLLYLPILKSTFTLSLLILILLLGFTMIFFFFPKIIFFHFPNVLNFIINWIFNLFRIIFLKIRLLLSKISIQILIILSFFILIIGLDYFFIEFLQEEGIFLIFEVIFNYSIPIIQIFFFIKGIKYLKIADFKQNFMLIVLISSFSLIGVLIFLDKSLAFYILNSRVLTIFVFCNLMIIQNNYLKDIFNKKNNKTLIIILFVLIYVGFFYSLRKLGWE